MSGTGARPIIGAVVGGAAVTREKWGQTRLPRKRGLTPFWAALVLAQALAGGPAAAEAPAKRITAWPLLYHAASETQAETDILWPLLRYERRDSYTRYAFRPFLFSTEGDPDKDYRETSVLWPLSIYRHTAETDWLHVFPVYWAYTGKGRSWWHLWPLYGSYHRGSYAEYSTLWPLFRYGSDPARGDLAWSAPWPLVGYEREGARVSHRVAPLYSYTHDADSSSGFVLPYFWSRGPDRDTQGVFPVWYSRDTPDHDTTLVLPFYFHDEQPREELTFITPLWAQRATPETRLRTLIPLYVDYETPAFGIEVGLPLYARYSTPESDFATLLPVYFHASDEARDSEFTYYFPLYGRYRRGEAVSQHYLLFPLWSRLEDREQQLVAYDALWPLFHYETSPRSLDVRALPFFWRSRAPDHAWTFALLLYGSMESDDRARSWLAPFYFRTRDGASSLALGSLAFLPPYYVNHRAPGESSFHVWPFYGVDRDGGYEETSFAWPLFRFGASDDGRRSSTQALLYYRSRSPDQAITALIPLWYHETEPDRVVDATLFLHWYHDTPQRRQWALFWLFPPELALARHARGPGYVSHGLFPLYGYERDDARDRVAWSALWPVFSYAAEGDVARESAFLWKVVTYERADAQTREFRFLWRLVRSSAAPGSSTFEFNPFYYREHEDGRGDYWNVLGGLLGKRTAEDGTVDMQWLWFF